MTNYNYTNITQIEEETMFLEEDIMMLEGQILEKVANNRALLAAIQVRDVVQSYKEFCDDVLDDLGGESTSGAYCFSLHMNLLVEAESRLRAVGFGYDVLSHIVRKTIYIG